MSSSDVSEYGRARAETKGTVPKKGSGTNCGVCNKPLPADNDPRNEICAECMAPDWTKPCEVCGQRPIMSFTGMCGPCTTGEAETVGGNW
jgi:hypothetical protein